MTVVLLQLLISGLLLGGVYALLSVGLTLVFGVLRVVNFAHGEYLMFAMYGTFWLFTLYGWDPYLTALVVVPGSFLFGLVSERVLIRRTLEAPHVVQVFVTLGLSIALQNAALALWTADFRSVRVPYGTATLEIGPLLISWPRLIAFVVAMASAVAVAAFLRWTYLGKAIRATAQDRRAARLMGVNVDRVYNWTFGIGSALVAVAGVLMAPLYPVNPTMGGEMILVAFVVVVLGGMGSLGGAVLGGLLIGIVESMTGFFLGGDMKQLVYFVVFILVLALLPAGLLGQRGAEVMEVT